MPIFEDVKNAGFPGLLLLVLGVVGILLSVVALVFVVSKQRAAFLTGLAALGLSGLILFGGALGTMYGRHQTDQALASGAVSKVVVERIRRGGYEEARSASKLGLIFGAAPLLMGAIAAFAGAGRRKEDAPRGAYAGPKLVAEPEGGAFVAPVIFLGLDILGIAGAALFLLAPLPGRAWAWDDPTWELLESTDEILHPNVPWGPEGPLDGKRGLGGVLIRCDLLADTLAKPGARRGDVPELGQAMSYCVELKIVNAKKAPTAAVERDRLEKLERSALVSAEEDRKKVREALEKIPNEDARRE